MINLKQSDSWKQTNSLFPRVGILYSVWIFFSSSSKLEAFSETCRIANNAVCAFWIKYGSILALGDMVQEIMIFQPC